MAFDAHPATFYLFEVARRMHVGMIWVWAAQLIFATDKTNGA
jgi:hypothetical protein